MRRESSTRRRRFLAIAICTVLGIVLGVVHNRLTARGANDPITGAVRTVTSPFVSAAGGVSGWLGRQTGWLFHGRTVDAENRMLRSENLRLREEISTLREADVTARRLNAQLGFAQNLPPRRVAARVIASRPAAGFETIVIDRGSHDGIAPRSVVVAPGGLVGRVYDVAFNSAVVLLITDLESSVGALVQRSESRAAGVCKGDRSPLLTLAYLDQNSDVRAGDMLITSGLGGGQGVFPKGIVIGVAQSVANDAPGSSRIVKVRPAVDFNRLEEVYVLR